MKPRFRVRSTVPLVAAALLTACAAPMRPLPGPVDYPRRPTTGGLAIGGEPRSTQRATETVVTDLPTSDMKPATAPAAAATAVATGTADQPTGDEVSMAIEQTPLPMFIQILYGNVLKLPYSMDQSINTRADIVTFKTSQPIPRTKLREVAVNLLRSYQLAVIDLGGAIRIVPENTAAASTAPVLRMGKTLPDTPDALRQAFQHVELDVGKVGDIGQWLRQILGPRVTVTDDASRNGFLLSGTQADLRLALDLIKTLDQPRMRGRIAKRISPAYMNPLELSARLNDVLTAQGYGVAVGQLASVPILIIPVNAIGSLIVFTTTDPVMEHVVRWARELDRPLSAQTQNGIYTYAVKYADAQELARTLGEILTGNTGPAASPAPVGSGGAGQTASAAPARAAGSAGNRVVVNGPTNTLIIRGTTAEEYQQIMALMRELDRPVKSALIEVVVAELRLGGSQALGIEWNVLPRSINSGQNIITGGTLGRLGIGSGGFSAAIANTAGQVIGQLNTLASNNKARILSNPKVLARNGETASIQVGQEVPVVTSQQSSSAGNLFTNTGVLQTIQYRSTGVILRVRPVINSGNRLDLEVSQEVSSAAETRTGVSASPTISTRRIETKLSLRDGSTVLLGGLISRSKSDADTGIPFLKDIPGLGAFFKTQSDSTDETELLIMITPYVISDDFESEAITDAIMKTFGEWSQDIRPARVIPVPPAPTVDKGPFTMTPTAPPPNPSAPVPVPNASGPATPAGAIPGIESPAPGLGAPTQAPAPGLAPTPDKSPVPGSPASGTAATAPTVPSTTTRPAANVPSRPAAVPPAPASGTTPATKPASPSNAPDTQPRQPGKPVDDPNVRKEIEEFLKKQGR